MWYRQDPGPCPVDGAPHTTCTAPSGPIVIRQMPARDGVSGARVQVPTPTPPALRAEAIQATLPPGQVTTGTYRRKKR